MYIVHWTLYINKLTEEGKAIISFGNSKSLKEGDEGVEELVAPFEPYKWWNNHELMKSCKYYFKIILIKYKSLIVKPLETKVLFLRDSSQNISPKRNSRILSTKRKVSLKTHQRRREAKTWKFKFSCRRTRRTMWVL